MRKLVSLLLAAALVVPLLVGLVGSPVMAQTTWTQTTKSDFEAGTLENLDTASSPGDVKLTSTAAYSWAFIADTLYSGAHGGLITSAGGDIYMGITYIFRRYTTAGVRTDLASQPDNFKSGSDGAWDGGDYIYVLCGGTYTTPRYLFKRYKISTNAWEALPNTPQGQCGGGSIVWVSTESKAYMLLGGTAAAEGYFVRFDPATNAFTTLAAPPGVDEGARLIWTGGDYIYATFGAYAGQNASFAFRRYSISANTWTPLADTPRWQEDGSDLAWPGGDYIYWTAGWDEATDTRTDLFYRYFISANSWEQIISQPRAIGYWNAHHLTATGGKVYWWQADSSAQPGGGDDLYRLDLTTQYSAQGVLTSSVHDAVALADWGTISWDATTPAGTSLAVQTHTSKDTITWSEWAAATSGGAVPSPDNTRYIQYRATFSTTDPSATPTLQEMRVSYTLLAPPPEDVTPPTIYIYEPGDGFLTRLPEVTLRGKTDDPTVTSVAVYLNGVQIATLPVTNQMFSTTLTLREGSNTIEVRAADAAGNVGKRSISGRYEPPPENLSGVLAPAVKGVRAKVTFAHPFVPEMYVIPAENAARLEITVRRVDAPPENVKPPLKAYAYLALTASPAIVQEAEVTFAVEWSWIGKIHVKYETVRLYKYEGGWQALETEIVGIGTENVSYSAKVSSFSTFVIAGETYEVGVTPGAGVLIEYLVILVAIGVVAGALAGWLSATARRRVPKRGWTPWG